MQVGAGPPFQNPPLVEDVGGACGASLRAWMQGRAIPGRRTQTPGRSPCFRTLPGLLSSLRGAGRHGGLMSESHPAGGVATEPLSADELRRLDAYWRAANYLSVGQIYLLDNPLL